MSFVCIVFTILNLHTHNYFQISLFANILQLSCFHNCDDDY